MLAVIAICFPESELTTLIRSVTSSTACNCSFCLNGFPARQWSDCAPPLCQNPRITRRTRTVVGLRIFNFHLHDTRAFSDPCGVSGRSRQCHPGWWAKSLEGDPPPPGIDLGGRLVHALQAEVPPRLHGALDVVSPSFLDQVANRAGGDSHFARPGPYVAITAATTSERVARQSCPSLSLSLRKACSRTSVERTLRPTKNALNFREAVCIALLFGDFPASLEDEYAISRRVSCDLKIPLGAMSSPRQPRKVRLGRSGTVLSALGGSPVVNWYLAQIH
jgi:hypothetical protein